MACDPDWTFSNQLELLAEALADKWRQNPDPWLERRVLVPNREIGHWLQHQLASRLGICSGMLWWTPRSLALELQRDRASKNASLVPTKGELQLSLYSALLTKLQKPKDRIASLWWPLKSAFSASNPSLNGEIDRQRLVQFSKLMSEIFERYSEFGARAVAKWEKGDCKDWQAELWCSLFGKKGPWCSLSQFCQILGDELTFDFKQPLRRQEIAVFGLRHLSNAHWRLLQRASCKMRVSIFSLSPCLYYWSDVRSSREQKRFLRWIATKGASADTLEAFESTLRQTHPLLASLGKVGRRFVEKSEFGQGLSSERYSLPADLAQVSPYVEMWQQDIILGKEKATLLNRLQADLLFMHSYREKPAAEHERALCDGSIEIHCAVSKSREIEIAAAKTLHCLAANQDLAYSDILLLAPDVTEYEALAESYFRRPEVNLPLCILDKSRPRFGGFWQSLSSLLQLATQGFSAEEVCQVLANPLIQTSIGFTAKETDLLIKAIDSGNVDWGLDADHRQRHLDLDRKGDDLFLNRGTFAEFHINLMKSLAFVPSHLESWDALIDPTQTKPLAVQDATTLAPVLGKWLDWFDQFSALMRPIAEKRSLSMSAWTDLLLKIIDALLPATSAQDQERFILIKWCRSWQQRAKDHPVLAKSIRNTPLCWKFAGDLLKEHMNQMTTARSFRHQGIRLTNLANGALPARVVIVMGLSEGALPRSHIRQPFELTNSEGVEYSPSPGDWDRCFFLEILLAARQKLFLTYCSLNQDDPLNHQEPSQLVSELLFTLSQMVDNPQLRQPRSIFESCDTSGKNTCHFYHPPSGADEAYFFQKSPFPSFDRLQFLCAQSAQSANPQPLGTRFSGLYPDGQIPLSNHLDLRFNLKSLSRALTSPLDFYLQERCRISLWKEKKRPNRWLLSKKEILKLQKLRLFEDFDENNLALSRPHLLTRVNHQRLSDQIKTFAAPLIESRKMGIELHLTAGVDQICWLDEQTLLSPAKTKTIDGFNVQIERELGDDHLLGPWGLIIVDNSAIKEIKLSTLSFHWPQIALFSEVQSALDLPRTILFGQNRRWCPKAWNHEVIWDDLMRLTVMAHRFPLPFYPDWFDAYERADRNELEDLYYKAVAKRIPNHPDTLSWIFGERVESWLFDFWIKRYHAHWRASIKPVMSHLMTQLASIKEQNDSKRKNKAPSGA